VGGRVAIVGKRLETNRAEKRDLSGPASSTLRTHTNVYWGGTRLGKDARISPGSTPVVRG
jgi:hypothetical protein